MRILVTGATGFLGSHLARRLLALGHEVSLLVRRPAAADALAAAGARILVGDLTAAEAVAQAVRQQDVVMHCAALSSVWGPYQAFYEANVLGTRRIVDAALASGKTRLVHVSSPSIYVGTAQKHDIDEDVVLPRRAINHYAATKRLAEAEVLRGVQAGLPALMLRPQAIFGPGDTAIVPRLIRANGQTGIPLFGDGEHLIDVTYVGNVVEAMVGCLSLGAPGEPALDPWSGRAYNLTNGEPVAFASFIADVLQRLGIAPRFRRLPLPVVRGATMVLEQAYHLLGSRREPPLTRYSLEVLSQPRTLSIARARRELDYAPRVSVAEGTEIFVRWWRETTAKEGGTHA